MRAALAAIVTVASLAIASMGLAAGLNHLTRSAIGSPSPTPRSEGPTPSPTLPSPSPLPRPTPSPSPAPSPEPPPSLYVGIINGNDYGNVEAETQPGAWCSLRVMLPNGSDAPGIHNPQTARASDGEVHWSYSQLPTDEGNGIHTVSCTLNGLSGTASVSFEVGS